MYRLSTEVIVMSHSIGPVDIEGVYEVEDEGGWNSPEQTVDRGFDFQSYTRRDPIVVRAEMVVAKEDIEAIRELRENNEPFGVSIGSVELPEATLEDIRVSETAEMRSHVRVSVTLREIFTAELETTELVLDVPDGTASGGESEVRISDNSGDDSNATAPADDDEDDDEDEEEETDDDNGGLLSSATSMMSSVSPF